MKVLLCICSCTRRLGFDAQESSATIEKGFKAGDLPTRMDLRRSDPNDPNDLKSLKRVLTGPGCDSRFVYEGDDGLSQF